MYFIISSAQYLHTLLNVNYLSPRIVTLPHYLIIRPVNLGIKFCWAPLTSSSKPKLYSLTLVSLIVAEISGNFLSTIRFNFYYPYKQVLLLLQRTVLNRSGGGFGARLDHGSFIIIITARVDIKPPLCRLIVCYNHDEFTATLFNGGSRKLSRQAVNYCIYTSVLFEVRPPEDEWPSLLPPMRIAGPRFQIETIYDRG